MKRAIFFSGVGTAYTSSKATKEEMEIYPETLHALRFLARRGYLLVLVTLQRQEYRWLRGMLKDKTIPVYFFQVGEEDGPTFFQQHEIDIPKSYFITDGLYLKTFQKLKCKNILVLSGRGVRTLESIEKTNLVDVCKDIYAAAMSIALNNSSLTER